MEKYNIYSQVSASGKATINYTPDPQGEWCKDSDVEALELKYRLLQEQYCNRGRIIEVSNVQVEGLEAKLKDLELKHRLLQQEVWSKDRIIERANIDAEDWLKRIQFLENANRYLLAMNRELEGKLEKLK